MAMAIEAGFSGHLDPPGSASSHEFDAYAGKTDLKDPVLSLLHAALTGFPPDALGRDLLLSGTSDLHWAYLRAGVDARLVVFDALPHAFWNNPALPESKEADQIMAKFLDSQLAK